MPEVTDEILSKLIAAAKANGIDLGVAPDGSDIGDLSPVIPAVSLNRAVSEIAHETGQNLKSAGLYLYGKELVTVDPDGSALPMDDARFRTWIDGWQINFYKRRTITDGEEKRQGPPIKATLKADVAKVLLRSDEFLSHVPEIKRILPVRLPVWEQTEDGRRRVRILPYGYDAETQVFTQNTGIAYDETWSRDQGAAYLRDQLKDFPYADPGRSLAVQVSAMVTTFCQLLFAERDNLPMIFFNANQPGSGKSRLAEMCIYPVYGTAESLTYAANDEFTKKLDSWAQNPVAYAFLDDVSGLVKNNDLNRWLTSPIWTFRYMHTQRNGSVFNQKLTLLTGNQAKLSDDLTRRMFMVDLWSSELASERQGRLAKVIDAEWLADAANRKDMLSALYALVRAWSDAGAPSYHKQTPSFEGWSRIVPAIVTAAGFDCPLAKADVQDAGGMQEVEFCRLLEVAARDYSPAIGKPVDILLTDWCRLARFIGVFHAIVSDTATARAEIDANPRLWKPEKDANGVERPLTEADKELQASRYMTKSESTKFGNVLNKFYRGQVRKIHGRTYKFADREARHSTFALELLAVDPSPPSPPAADDMGGDDPF